MLHSILTSPGNKTNDWIWIVIIPDRDERFACAKGSSSLPLMGCAYKVASEDSCVSPDFELQKETVTLGIGEFDRTRTSQLPILGKFRVKGGR